MKVLNETKLILNFGTGLYLHFLFKPFLFWLMSAAGAVTLSTMPSSMNTLSIVIFRIATLIITVIMVALYVPESLFSFILL
jgi:hypothetical protein